MKFQKAIGLLAALLVLGFLSVALVVHSQHPVNAVMWALSTLSLMAGAVTVTYKYPISGLTAPIASQVYGLGVVTAQVNAADTDTSIVVTHNFGLSAAELADLFPLVLINTTAAGVSPAFTFSKGTNSVTITKASTSGTGGTFDVIILRPHTNQAGGSSGNR